jgi:hypothetical protein
MKLSEIKALLEQKLLAMPGVLPTAFENVSFTPPAGPYQACYHLINRPVNHGVGADLSEERGILQVTVRYPGGKGRQLADAMVDQIKAHFKPPLRIAGTDFRIELNKAAYASSGTPDEGRWCIPVSIYWRAFQT